MASSRLLGGFGCSCCADGLMWLLWRMLSEGSGAVVIYITLRAVRGRGEFCITVEQ